MKPIDARLQLSVIVPLFNEAGVIGAFWAALQTALGQLDVEPEIILVDDGSTDDTWNQLNTLAGGRDGVLLLRFSRNFGKEAAVRAGLEHCRGDAVVVMDGDLQHPPALLPAMLECWLAGDVDVVDGVKQRAAADALGAPLFNRLFSSLTGYPMAGASDFKLISRRAVDLLLQQAGYSLFFRGSTQWLGLQHQVVEYGPAERVAGESKWNLMSRLRLAITAITSFTALPLQLMTLAGLLALVFALLLALQTLVNWLGGEAVEGFTTVILLILIFGSVITLGLGIIGAYLSKIHDEVRARPHYLLQDSVDRRSRP